jgi:hypothetical protein
MVQHLCIRAACVEHLESLDKMRRLPSEPLGDMPGRLLFSSFRRWELDCYFLFAESVVLEPLGRLSAIHDGREHVVEAELPGENVHHDVYNALIVLVGFGGGRAFEWEPVQDIYGV